MQKNRRHLNEILYAIENQQRRLDYQKEDLVKINGQESYDEVKKYYATAIKKLKKELQKLPIGHRYTGTFYIRKPYTSPIEFQEVVGSVFMKEDLVSWQFESGVDQATYGASYFRSIHKEPKIGREFEIEREDGEPVFAPVEMKEEI